MSPATSVQGVPEVGPSPWTEAPQSLQFPQGSTARSMCCGLMQHRPGGQPPAQPSPVLAWPVSKGSEGPRSWEGLRAGMAHAALPSAWPWDTHLQCLLGNGVFLQAGDDFQHRHHVPDLQNEPLMSESCPLPCPSLLWLSSRQEPGDWHHPGPHPM